MTTAAPFDQAELYRSAGWSGVLALPTGKKFPPPEGVTGADGRWSAPADWARWRAEGLTNIALRLPPVVVGIDVDAYPPKHGAVSLSACEAKWGPLPPTWVSTSRTDGVSGIGLYRVPAGIEGWPSQAGPDIEIIRYAHRYAMVWPSVHPDGRVYRWVKPDGTDALPGEVPRLGDLPYLPDAWVAGLTGTRPDGTHDADHTRPGSRAEVRGHRKEARAWIAGLPAGDPCPYVARLAADALAAARREDGAAHDHTRDAVLALLRAGDVGHPGVPAVLGEVRETFVATVSDTRSLNLAAAEFDRFTDDGAALVMATPSDRTGTGCDCAPARAGDDGHDHAPGREDAPRGAADTTAGDDRMLRGGDAILDGPEAPEPLWGHEQEVLWAEGESLMVVGGDGTGKSTLAQNIIMNGLGLQAGDLLGYPMRPFTGSVLYVAADRPRQVLRSLRRLVGEGDRDVLNERLRIWPGPLPFDILTDPSAFRPFVEAQGCTTVVVDSIKDVILEVSSDAGGQAYNYARQDCLAHDIQVLELHHPRKVQAQQATGAQSAISAVHGSRWLVAGAGSVLLLQGDPGDALIRLRHLKQPSGEVIGLEMRLDQDAGTVSVAAQPNLLTYLRGRPNGATVPEAAAYMEATSTPSKNAIERTRRALSQLCRKGLAHEVRGDAGGARGGELARFYAVTERDDNGHGNGHGNGHAPLFHEAGTVRARTGTDAPETVETAGTVRARTGTPPMGTNAPPTLVGGSARATSPDEAFDDAPDRDEQLQEVEVRPWPL